MMDPLGKVTKMKNTSEYSVTNRAAGMLAGVAIGDALGMPTEFLTQTQIANWYGQVEGFVKPHPKHPHHRLPAGSVTDDTDHMLILARLLIDRGEVIPAEFAEQLLAWSQTQRVRENCFVGPSTIKTLSALLRGVPLEQVPRNGTSIGAAMRVAPLAIAFSNREALIQQVVASCAVSHYTTNAISGAMAMAFALSEALQPAADLVSIARAAQEGAIVGRRYGDWCWTPPIERRIGYVLAWVNHLSEEDVLRRLYELIGVDLYPEQLVPCVIGIALIAAGNPTRAMRLAANFGGDTDTLASMVGSICGALSGIEAIDLEMLNQVEKINQLDFHSLAEALLKLRKSESVHAMSVNGDTGIDGSSSAITSRHQ
jgi:ADP-ribosylglycohydrolase